MQQSMLSTSNRKPKKSYAKPYRLYPLFSATMTHEQQLRVLHATERAQQKDTPTYRRKYRAALLLP